MMTRDQIRRLLGDNFIDGTSAARVAREFAYHMFIPSVKEEGLAMLIEAAFDLGFDIGSENPAVVPDEPEKPSA